jgi:uroporphyrin-III C-methyltransferase/precorrin-2 dehydrogenase/sirohydrochlorin ferrochelatase
LKARELTLTGLFSFSRRTPNAERLMTELLPLFVNLAGRRVVLVGGGPVAAAKLTQLLAARADVLVVSPEVHADIERSGVAIARREFDAADLDGAWLVVAAATPAVNRIVAQAADLRRIFVNAVDDPANATAFLSGVVRRDGVTLAISTSGDAPGLTALLREALDAILPRDLGAWMREARRQRATWRRDGVPMSARRPLLLEALNRLSGRSEDLRHTGDDARRRRSAESHVAQDFSPAGEAGVAQDFSPAGGEKR